MACIDEILVAQHRLERRCSSRARAPFRSHGSSPRLRQRPDVADMDMGDAPPLAPRALHCSMDGAEGRAPADDDEIVSPPRPVPRPAPGYPWRCRGSCRGGCRSSSGGWPANSLMGWCPAFSMPPMRMRPGVPGLIHGRREALVARIRPQRAAVLERFRHERDRERRVARHVRHAPGLGGIGDVAVRQHDHRRHVARVAIRQASIAQSNASAGERAAMTGIGASPLRP